MQIFGICESKSLQSRQTYLSLYRLRLIDDMGVFIVPGSDRNLIQQLSSIKQSIN